MNPGVRWVFSIVCLPCVWLATGCDSAPRAPALRDSAVYQNNREGFRFLVPDGWLQSASSVLPDDLGDGEILLVQYKMRTPSKSATVEILCFDETEPQDLEKYHALPSHGVRKWIAEESAKDLEINGTSAERYSFSAMLGDDQMMKDVVAFRRGKRVYSIIGMFFASDEKARQQLQRAAGSVIWKN